MLYLYNKVNTEQSVERPWEPTGITIQVDPNLYSGYPTYTSWEAQNNCLKFTLGNYAPIQSLVWYRGRWQRG